MKKSNKIEFIEKAIKVHGHKYDYSKVDYVNSKTKVCIICHEKDSCGVEHGEFWVTPNGHLHGYKCSKCIQRCTGINDFIEKAKKIHDNKYNYNKTKYINSKTKVCIICPEHGEFWQTPHDHLEGHGCGKCSHEVLKILERDTLDTFIKKAKKTHGDRYDYSLVKYNGSHEYVSIICPKHGVFYQKAYVHINGSGCPKCRLSRLEELVRINLEKNGIIYIAQYRNKKILGRLTYDFYFPDLNIAIECQGKQHFNEGGFCGKEELTKIQERDKRKKEISDKNNIKILYFSDEKFKNYTYYDKIYTNINDIINILKRNYTPIDTK